MKIICLQENLKNGLTTAERIIGKNLTLPILNNLLLKTDKGKLKISSTNLEIGINYWASGKIEKEGEITIPAKVLSSIINQLPNKKIELEVKEGVIQLKCENYKAKIKGQSAKEFPIIPKIQPQAEIEINKGNLREGLSQVVGMAAISEARPEISGILFSFDKNKLKLAATDSFRLAEKSIFLKTDFVGAMIVPQRTALELIRILSDQTEGKENDDVVKVGIGVNQVLFDLGYIQLVSRLIDGQYPDYQQIIPTSFQTKVIADRDELAKTIKIASLFSSKINDVHIKAFPQKGIMEIFSQNADIGENMAQIKAEGEGKETAVSFNWRYFLDGLNNISSNKVLCGLNNETAAAIIKPADEEDYVYVVMPIRAT
jgi:DNA polymerase-3 subunit beta